MYLLNTIDGILFIEAIVVNVPNSPALNFEENIKLVMWLFVGT